MDKLDPNLNSPFQIDYKAIKEHRDAKKDEAKKLNRLLQGKNMLRLTIMAT